VTKPPAKLLTTGALANVSVRPLFSCEVSATVAVIKLDDGCSSETERHVEQGVMHIFVSTFTLWDFCWNSTLGVNR